MTSYVKAGKKVYEGEEEQGQLKKFRITLLGRNVADLENGMFQQRFP